ncbi:MAG TPA: ABC transporter ATP-binding protein [Rectinemataceae bacterium]|nr:ABC transporter ATP-binding protein [Rectinemataceae bacterium]
MQTVDTEAEVLLEIRNLSIHYPISIGTVKAVNDVSLDVFRGEVLGIVGESGCGKSTLGLSILNLQKPPGRIVAGSVRVDGVDILALEGDGIRNVRGPKIGMIFQNPLTSLDPLMSIKDHFIETLRAHEPKIKDDEALKRAETILEDLGIEKRRLSEYPFQLSGGMRQRIMIGLTLVLDPKLLLADEPTTALDVIVEAGFTELLAKLKRKYNLTVILVSHNLGLVAEIADRIAVMYAGRIVELASVGEIFQDPRHPYTKGLMDCVPNILLDQADLPAMPGSPPDLVNQKNSCPFAPRCPKVMDICLREEPKLEFDAAPAGSTGSAAAGRAVACHLHKGHN